MDRGGGNPDGWGITEIFRGVTETFRDITETFWGTTETFRGVTETFRGATETFWGITETFGLKSERQKLNIKGVIVSTSWSHSIKFAANATKGGAAAYKKELCMKHNDWIPSREQDLAELCLKWDETMGNTASYTQFGWTQPEREAVQEKLNNFMDARRAYEDDKTAAKRLIKDQTKEAAIAAMREFANSSIRYNPKMTDANRLPLGIHPKDTNPTPQPVPHTVPEIETDSSVIRQLSFRLRDFGAKTWAKPDHVHGMELAWVIAAARPADASEMPHLETATANPIVLPFKDEQRGSHVFYAARWINNTSQHGPWSDIESAFVP